MPKHTVWKYSFNPIINTFLVQTVTPDFKNHPGAGGVFEKYLTCKLSKRIFSSSSKPRNVCDKNNRAYLARRLLLFFTKIIGFLNSVNAKLLFFNLCTSESCKLKVVGARIFYLLVVNENPGASIKMGQWFFPSFNTRRTRI